MDIASAVQKIDINSIGEKIDQFVLAAQEVKEACKRIECKLDAVIDAAEIKVNDGNSSSSDSCRESATRISIGNAEAN